MDRYTAKRRLLRPLTAWRRRRASRLGPIDHGVWAAMGYSPGMRRFFHAARADPAILVDANVPQGAVVLDVGAFEGSWASRVLARLDEGAERPHDVLIHAFEPEAGAVDRMRSSPVGHDPRVAIHPFGLAGRTRVESLIMAGPGSTVLDHDATGSGGDRVTVELRDVDEVLRDLGVERVHFAKVNIEGGEYELIDRLHETGWLARMGPVIVQFHEFAPHAHRARRRNRRQLAHTHRRTWAYGWVYERWDPR